MHILIVDDEMIIRNGLKNMMLSYSRPFASIRVAENGEQALGLIADYPPHIIITDIRMPKMDGLEFCRRIHESYKYIKVVVISGFAEFEYAQQCMAYGVKEYMLKPVIKLDIHEMLNRILPAMEKGVITPTQLEKWLDEMTEHIWQLRLQDLDQCLDEWLRYCEERTVHPFQLRELLVDSFQAVLDRLKVKGHTYTGLAADIEEKSVGEIHERFRHMVRSVADELTLRRGGFKDVMAEVRAYMEQNIAREVTLEEVANLVGLTPNYFSLYFKKTTGVTFIHYRMTKRIEAAEQLLAQPHYRIVDVAHETGYEDYSHFAKTFRKVKGITPTEFRSRLGIK
ncbi:two-component system response regulator YesN [Paenibacillus castaneae]|uniref:response regulator transcription factor n=1 Tax=Paenibacillus castaneae TaxID=474957 RepID=UPI00141AC55A|nr:response regulator [Paenibacillus castaneae]NIK78780.1 two-component system response regulator YesN [Paenibacillus castaneae]